MGARQLAAAAAVIASLLVGSPAARAFCPPPVLEKSYQGGDGRPVNVYRVPPGTNGEDCLSASLEWAGDKTRGNSAGTASFEMLPTASEAEATCQVRIVDGTTMLMKGVPRISAGRFAFTNAQGRLVQLPLREVVSTDSGKRFQCKSCKRDGSGRPLADPAVRDAFTRTTPCPATGANGPLCPGYVVDHVTPLACGGDDTPANLQWQSEAEAKRKEAWRVKACGW